MTTIVAKTVEILNALIQKGLRPREFLFAHRQHEILNALIQKGLRQVCRREVTNHLGNTECPDSKGIKTVLGNLWDGLYWKY